MSTSSMQNINCPVCGKPRATTELDLATGESVVYCDHELDILICDRCELPIRPGDEYPVTFQGDASCFCGLCIIESDEWVKEEFGD